MKDIEVELGSGDCPCCHKRVPSGKMIFVDSGLESIDYEICVDCYDKLHKIIMETRKRFLSNKVSNYDNC